MFIIEEGDYRERVEPEELDALLARGWRHFGPQFFRYNLAFMGESFESIIALRIDLERFEPTRSLRRILRKNSDTVTRTAPASITAEKIGMFEAHADRFERNTPDSIFSFLSPTPDVEPCECISLDVHLSGQPDLAAREPLIASSYLDIGGESASSVYAMFDPEHGKRGLGHYTILKEIEYARERGKRWYYIGYATLGPSVYDYKRRLPALEVLDWHEGTWNPLERLGS